MIASHSSRVSRAVLVLWVLASLGCPTRPTWPYDVQRGRILADHNDGEGAEQRLRLALSEAERDAARPWGVPISLYYLADVYLRYPRLGKTAEAIPLLERSREQWERLAGSTDPTIAVVLLRLSDAEELRREVEGLLERARLPVRLDPAVSVADILNAVKRDKKRDSEGVRFVLLARPGEPREGQLVDRDRVRRAVEELAQ